MRDVTSAGPAPSRRLVTAGALGAVVAALTGCGIRLEDDAPRVPLVPARSPIDGEDSLLRLLAAVQAATLVPAVPQVAISALLAPLHQRQATVLHDALRQRGVPQDELPSALPSPTSSPSGSGSPSAVASATPSATPSASPSAPVTPLTLATSELAIITAGVGCHESEPELRPSLLSLLALSHAALELAAPAAATTSSATTTSSTATTPTPTTTGAPMPTWSTPAALAPIISAVRTATYFLEVAAARSPRAVRRAWLPGIARLQTLAAEIVEAAGESAPAPELGRALPHPVTTPAEAATLATEALSTLLGSFGAALPSLSADDADADAAFAAVPRWLGTVAAQAHRHGIPLTAFPALA